MVGLAEQHRPDLIELKLIIEADEQRLLQARNQSSPRLDAVALYRWNGLYGEVPSTGVVRRSRPGQFTDWSFTVDFSVPLGLRRERAQLRRQELIIARDWANLEQGLQTAIHILGQSYRNLAHLYRQYEISRDRRTAARTNLTLQMESYRTGKTAFINVLLAINDWGNSISSEAQFLTQYNQELANLERETGTILETHGIRFYEERFASIGPLGRLARMRCYPLAMRPAPNEDRYPSGTEPAENSFNLENPVERLDN
jgi:outer membrane protein TolC